MVEMVALILICLVIGVGSGLMLPTWSVTRRVGLVLFVQGCIMLLMFYVTATLPLLRP